MVWGLTQFRFRKPSKSYNQKTCLYQILMTINKKHQSDGEPSSPLGPNMFCSNNLGYGVCKAGKNKLIFTFLNENNEIEYLYNLVK